MRRILTIAVLAAGLLGLGAGAANAQDRQALIEALPQNVTLDQNPWSPTGDLKVTVKNHGPGTAVGHFLLHLPSGVELGSGTGCRQADGESSPRISAAGSPSRWGPPPRTG